VFLTDEVNDLAIEAVLLAFFSGYGSLLTLDLVLFPLGSGEGAFLFSSYFLEADLEERVIIF
jgi:hypothetical protein